jgi:hypothetical protein
VAQLPEVLLRVLLKAQLLLQLLLLKRWGAWRGLPGQLSHNWPKKQMTNLQQYRSAINVMRAAPHKHRGYLKLTTSDFQSSAFFYLIARITRRSTGTVFSLKFMIRKKKNCSHK